MTSPERDPARRPVIESMELGPLENQAYLLGDAQTREAILVDIGSSPGAFLDRVDAGGWTVTGLVATHAHFDHIAGLKEAQDRTGAPVRVPAGEAEWLFDPEKNLSALFAAGMGTSSFRVTLPTETVVRPLREGEIFSVGRHEVRVLSTPGHTPDSRCLYVLDAECVLTGDTLFAGAVGRTDLPGGDSDRLHASLRLLLTTLSDFVRVLPGHGPETRLGLERDKNPYLAQAR